MFIILMALSSGHNSHHQAISQKLKKAGTYSANYIDINVNGIPYVLTILHHMYWFF